MVRITGIPIVKIKPQKNKNEQITFVTLKSSSSFHINPIVDFAPDMKSSPVIVMVMIV